MRRKSAIQYRATPATHQAGLRRLKARRSSRRSTCLSASQRKNAPTATLKPTLGTQPVSALRSAVPLVSEPASGPESCISENPRLRQGHDEFAAVPALAEVGPKLLGDVPREQQRILRLLAVELFLIQHRNARTGHELVELVRIAHFDHEVEERVVEPQIGDERAGPRGRSDPENPLPAALQVSQQSQEV